MSKNKEHQSDQDQRPHKGVWEAMTVRYIGDMKDLVLGGGGKTSIPAADPGDDRKPEGIEP